MSDHVSRKSALINLLTLPLAAGAIVATANAASAAGAPQSAVQYQNHPKGAAKCSGCKFYVPNKAKPSANGACTQVSGVISPNGWCAIYNPKG